MEPGPSMNGWVNIRGLMNQIYQPDSDVNDSIRYYLNSRASSEDSWLTEPAIQSHVAYKQLVDDCIEANIGSMMCGNGWSSRMRDHVGFRRFDSQRFHGDCRMQGVGWPVVHCQVGAEAGQSAS